MKSETLLSRSGKSPVVKMEIAAGGNQWLYKCSLKNLHHVLLLIIVAVALSPPRHLSFSEIGHGAVKVSWDAASRAVRAHRVTYISSRGSNAGEASPCLGTQECAKTGRTAMECECAVNSSDLAVE